MRRPYRCVFVLSALLCFSLPGYASQTASFNDWLQNFRAKALQSGISEGTLNQAFDGLEEDEMVVKLDRKQPESKITLSKYLQNTVTPRRIKRGKALLQEHKTILDDIAAKYGVPAPYIVALWGIESDYGAIQGDFSVVQSLATLAYEGRRRDFFAEELLQALRILERGDVSVESLTGSWAGAMGNCQFMPSTYLNFAVDGNGDGKRDIWASPEDTFASIANYVHSLGWKREIGWGGPATAPKHTRLSKSSINRGKSASAWSKQGVRLKNNTTVLSKPSTTLYAIYPGSNERGVFLVTDNYKALLQWNRSRYFATAVGTLADAIGE